MAQDTVQWTLGHQYSFQRWSKAWTKGHRYLLLFRGHRVNLWALVGVFRVGVSEAVEITVESDIGGYEAFC